ncbi:MAG: histidinol-phosphatase HisJ family protein [Clostridiales bacterium]|nr:histidinol-phosphatase HisJ family protein [Clostridiales bacterium]
MKLIPNATDLSNMDCHIHSKFSPDANACGADEPQKIADTVRANGLRGFIITDHIDVGHWDGYIIDFDKYFSSWNRVRDDNPDLTIYIGLEVGYEQKYERETAKLVKDLPLEYVINSVHYYPAPTHADEPPFLSYLNAIRRSLDVDYEFSTIGHIGFLERYRNIAMNYETYRDILDDIIKVAVARGIRIEENTNGALPPHQPREEFLRAYKAAGGEIKPVLGSDAHISDKIGQHFKEASEWLNKIFE